MMEVEKDSYTWDSKDEDNLVKLVDALEESGENIELGHMNLVQTISRDEEFFDSHSKPLTSYIIWLTK